MSGFRGPLSIIGLPIAEAVENNQRLLPDQKNGGPYR
jgi:hypothetical protein